jgi:hypothetical protein
MSIPAFLDTGCSYSLIRKSLVKKITKQIDPIEPIRLMSMDNQFTSPIGAVHLNIQIGHKKFRHRFLVMDKIPYPLFIGRDLIRKSDMVIHDHADEFWCSKEPDKKYTLKPVEGKYVYLMQRKDIEDASNPDMQEQVRKLLDKYPSVYRKDGSLGRCNVIKHKIELIDNKPIFVRPMNYPPKHTEEIRKQINILLEKGLIRETSTSPYTANVVLAPKKNGSLRMAISYKKLNSQTIRNSLPMPKAGIFLKRLPAGGWYSVVDCDSGFWQIEMEEESIPMTCFQFDGRLYQFKVVPFGLKNSPATFVACMNETLRGLIGDFLYVYMDDIIIFSKTKEEHLKHLEILFQRLEKSGLSINHKKSIFAQRSIDFLGHVVSEKGVQKQEEKIVAVKNFPRPNNVEQLQRFLGMCGWYQGFIQHYATIADPLYKLLPKKTQWLWTNQHQKSFDALTRAMCEDVVLSGIDYRFPIVVKTDASNTGLGAVLEQNIDGKDRVICYASKTLNKSEKLLHACEKELLAILWAVEKFKEFIYGENFSIITDNQALKYLKQFKEDNSKLGRWAMRLAPYTDRIFYRPGKENVVADALSRASGPVGETEPNYLEDDPEVMFTPVFAMFENVLTLDEIRQEQERDEEIQRMKRDACQMIATSDCDLIMEDGILKKLIDIEVLIENDEQNSERNERSTPGLVQPVDVTRGVDQNVVPMSVAGPSNSAASQGTSQRQVGEQSTDSNSQAETVTRQPITRRRNFNKKSVPVIPKSLRERVIQYHHDEPHAGHGGMKKTKDLIRKRAYWPGMFSDIAKYVKSCLICQQTKYPNQKPAGVMGLSKNPEGIFDSIFIDFMGPFVPSSRGRQNRFLLVVQDELSKWVEMFPMRTATAAKTKELLEDQIFCRYGSPRTIISDHGSQFTSNLMKKLCAEWNVEHRMTSIYHPQPNQAERSNRNIIPMIAAFVEGQHSSWDHHLQKFALALRNAVSDTTRVTPALLNLGRDIPTPFDRNMQGTSAVREVNHNQISKELKNIIQWVKSNMTNAKQRYKAYYDERHRNVEYSVGQLVWSRNHPLSSAEEGINKKLSPKWIGPFTITKKVTPVTYALHDSFGSPAATRHVNDIKPYISRQQSSPVLSQPAPLVRQNQFPSPNNFVNNPRRSGRTTHQVGRYQQVLNPRRG